MKTDYLLPHIFRKVGWFIFIPCSVMIMVSWLGINDWFNDDTTRDKNKPTNLPKDVG